MIGYLLDRIFVRGGTDRTLIGNTADRIKALPTLTSKFRILYDETNQSVTSSYVTLYSYSGSGVFFGSSLNFNNTDVRVRLSIDGEEIFALTLDELSNIESASAFGNDYSSSNLIYVNQTSDDIFNMYFPHGIYYASSVVIQAQRSGSFNRTQDNQIVYIEKLS